MIDEEEGRAEYGSHVLCILNCTPGNWDHPQGEPATIITTISGKNSDVVTFSINQRDTRFLAVKMLVVLATEGDEFAQKVLDDFPADDEGDFIWPREIGRDK